MRSSNRNKFVLISSGLILFLLGFYLAIFQTSDIWYSVFLIGGFLLLEGVNFSDSFSVFKNRKQFLLLWLTFIFITIVVELIGNYFLNLWDYPTFDRLDYLVHVIIVGYAFTGFFGLEFFVLIERIFSSKGAKIPALLIGALLFGYLNEYPNTFAYEWKYINWPFGEFLGIPILVSLLWVLLPIVLLFKKGFETLRPPATKNTLDKTSLSKINKEKMVEYYDSTLPYYKLFWRNDVGALHYGLWGKKTKTLREALINTNKFLARAARITHTDKVLDAGCGIGGSAIWFAKNLRAHVVGITLSARQQKEAIRLAKKEGVEDNVEFYIKDFLDTGYQDNSFDVVVGIESVCHVENKRDFLREAYRILKRGGRVIVADGFLRRNVEDSERQMYKKFLDGLAVPNLATIIEFQDNMIAAGFKDIKSWDKTKEIERSSWMLYIRTKLFYPLAMPLYFLGLIPRVVMKNGPAGIAQYGMVKIGLVSYGVFYGEK